MGAGATLFPDISGHHFREQIEVLEARGVVQGYPDGAFRPNAGINRAEFLKILWKVVEGGIPPPRGTACFPDVTEEEWYWSYACAAKARGIVRGYPDGSFGGERSINTVEALKMVIEAWGIPYGKANGRPWYAPYQETARGFLVMDLLPTDPAHLLTRGEMAAIVVAFGKWKEEVRSSSSSSSRAFPILPLEPTPFSLPSPIRRGVLWIEQGTLADRTVSVGAKQVPLLHFQALAGRQDVSITTLKFQASEGSLEAASAYSLYIDSEGGGTFLHLPVAGKVSGNLLTFAPVDIRVPDGWYTHGEVRADFPPGRSATSLKIVFATGEGRFVEAVGAVDGRDLPGIQVDAGACPSTFSLCWTTVRTEPGSLVTVGSVGNLFVNVSPLPIPGRQLLLGAETPPLLRLRLRAEREDIAVRSLAFAGVGGSVAWLSIRTEGGRSPLGFARVSGCSVVQEGRLCATFSEGALTIPKDQELDLVVTGVLKADTEGGKSGESLRLILQKETLPTFVEAQGKSSLKDLEQNDGDAIGEGEIVLGRDTPGPNTTLEGPTHETVAATILHVENTNTDAEGSPVPLGTAPLAQFRFRAAEHRNSLGGLNNVVLQSLRFTVHTGNVALVPQKFRLFLTGDPSRSMSCTADASTGVITVTCASLQSTAAKPMIPVGGSVEMVLEGEVAQNQVGVGGSTLQVSLQNLQDRVSGPVEWTDGETTFHWVDSGEQVVRSTGYRLP